MKNAPQNTNLPSGLSHMEVWYTMPHYSTSQPVRMPHGETIQAVKPSWCHTGKLFNQSNSHDATLGNYSSSEPVMIAHWETIPPVNQSRCHTGKLFHQWTSQDAALGNHLETYRALHPVNVLLEVANDDVLVQLRLLWGEGGQHSAERMRGQGEEEDLVVYLTGQLCCILGD